MGLFYFVWLCGLERAKWIKDGWFINKLFIFELQF
uniref:Uncharacterized protein n=2 Tax=unclassified Caudoviricetes TaxID=2788787 RepID=A0A8S5PJI4_9CAUD|nr:MAG TPA: hypothetical protein [Siphoviridae sp. ctJcm18]DAE06569.1 MAG TPA: hypothetical protein [Siphoviridae sp. ctUGQ45]